MKSWVPSAGSINYFWGIVGVAVAGFLGYCYFAVTTQQVSQNRDLLRALGTFGHGVESLISGMRDPVDSLLAQRSGSGGSGDGACPNPGAEKAKIVDWIKDINRRNTQFRVEQSASCDRSEGFYLMDNPRSIVYCAGGPSGAKSISVVADLAEMVSAMSWDAGAFNHLAIVLDDGNVLYEKPSPELTIVNIGSFLTGSDTEKIKGRWNQSSFQTTAAIGGKDYRVSVQPLRLSIKRPPPKSEPVTLFAVGLQQNESFLRESLAIPYSVAIFVALCILLTFLSMPLLKVQLMGGRDRMAGMGIVSLVLALWLGTGAATFLVLHCFCHADLHDRLDEQLVSLAQSVTENLDKEIDLTLRTLDMLEDRGGFLSDQCLAKGAMLADESVLELLAPGGDPLHLFFQQMVRTDEKGNQVAKWAMGPVASSFVRVDRRDYFRELVRNPFRRRPLGGGGDPEDFDSFYVESVVSRSTGDRVTVVSKKVQQNVSEKVQQNVSKKDQQKSPDQVKFTSGPLVSLYDPVLPKGFGFALINREGKVLLHSEKNRNLNENLIDETDQNTALTASVGGLKRVHLDATYGGVPHRMYVSPLRYRDRDGDRDRNAGIPEIDAGIPDRDVGIPWMLVTFGDGRYVSTTNLEIVTISAMLFTGYVAVFAFLLFVAVFATSKWRPGGWYWPEAHQRWTYERLTFALFGLIAANFLWVSGGEPLQSPPLAFVFPFLGTIVTGAAFYARHAGKERAFDIAAAAVVVATIAGAAFAARPDTPRWVQLIPMLAVLFAVATALRRAAARERHRREYAAAVFLVLVLLAIVPAVTFFKIAQTFELQLQVKYGQMTLAQSLEARRLRIDAYYANIRSAYEEKESPGAKALRKVQERRLSLVAPGADKKPQWDLYHSFWFNTTVSVSHSDAPASPRAAEPDGLLSLLTSMRPLYDTVSRDTSAVDTAEWNARENTLVYPRGAKAPHTQIQSQLPPLDYSRTLWWWPVVAAFLVGLAAVVRFLTNRIFPYVPDPPSQTVWDEGMLRENLAVVGATADVKEQICERQHAVRIDCGALIEMPSVLERLADEDRCIAIDNFREFPDNEDVALRIISALEKLTGDRRTRAILFSAQFPLSFPLAGELPPEAKVEYDRDLARRWLGVWSRFSFVFADSAVSRQWFSDALEARRENLRSMLAGAEVARVERLFEVLKEECAPAHQLRVVGAKLAHRQDFPAMQEDYLLEEIGREAAAYYSTIWSQCSLHQKRVLCQAALGELVGWRSVEALRSLMRRQLIVHSGGYRVMNRSFAEFAGAAAAAERVFEEAQGESGSAWESLRWPLRFALLMSTVAFIWTQPELVKTTTGLAATALSTIPVLMKFFSMFQSRHLLQAASGADGGSPGAKGERS